MYVSKDGERVVRFAQDTLNPGARGRNGDFKTSGVQVAASTSGPLSSPEVPTLALTPINSKGEVTGSCVVMWPMHDTAELIDALLGLQGFSPAKRKAVAGLLNAETDARVDLDLDEPTPIRATYGPCHVDFAQDMAGGVAVEVFVHEQRLHRFAAPAEELAAVIAQQNDARINWSRP